jgi:RsiW-degrading membrane proteinase PrsW (M82 family)
MTFLIASITPVIIFLYLIFRKDARPEPLPLLAKCFFGGFLSVVLTLLIGSLMQPQLAEQAGPLRNALYQAFVLASIPEEVSKWLVLYWLVMKSTHFDEHYDGIQYAVFVSLGFALVENVLYVFEGGLTVALFRGVLAVPGHGFFAVLMGYFLSLARLGISRHRTRNLVLSLAYPILFHGLYDFFLMYMNQLGDTSVLLSILLMVAFTLTVIKLWRVGLGKIRQHLHTDQQSYTKETISLVDQQNDA